MVCPNGTGCDGSTGNGGGSQTCTVGVPDKPGLSSPTDGEIVAATGNPTTVTLTWQAPSNWNSCDGTNLYDVYVEQDDTPGDGLPTERETCQVFGNLTGLFGVRRRVAALESGIVMPHSERGRLRHVLL